MKVLITLGRTVEPIDAVRYISNHSSGKLGLALAKAFIKKRITARVITGVTDMAIPQNMILARAQTARDMKKAVLRYAEGFDIVILAAAVSDYEPAQKSSLKIPKTGHSLNLKLKATPDIAKILGTGKKRTGKPRLLVGFALESDHLIPKATKKLNEKSLDLIIANHIATMGSDRLFQSCIIDHSGKVFKLPRVLDKNEAAEIMAKQILNAYHTHSK